MKYQKILRKLYKQYKKNPVLQKINEDMKSKFHEVITALTIDEIRPIFNELGYGIQKFQSKPIESFKIFLYNNSEYKTGKLWDLLQEKLKEKKHFKLGYLKGNKIASFDVYFTRPIVLKCIYCENKIKESQLGILIHKKFHYCDKCFKEYCCNQDLNYAQDCENLRRNMLCDHYLHNSMGKIDGCPNQFEVEAMYENEMGFDEYW